MLVNAKENFTTLQKFEWNTENGTYLLKSICKSHNLETCHHLKEFVKVQNKNYNSQVSGPVFDNHEFHHVYAYL